MLRLLRGSLCALLALTCCVSIAAAQPPGGPPRGRVDDRPRGPGGPPDADAVFERIDTNDDDSISRREFNRAHEELMDRLRGGFPGGPPFAGRGDGDSRGPRGGFNHSRFDGDHGPPEGRGPRPTPTIDRRDSQRPPRDEDDDDRRPGMGRDDDDDDHHRGPRPPFASRDGDDDHPRPHWGDRDDDDGPPHRPPFTGHFRRPGFGGPPGRMDRDDNDDNRPAPPRRGGPPGGERDDDDRRERDDD